jgi:hypothetical protein
MSIEVTVADLSRMGLIELPWWYESRRGEFIEGLAQSSPAEVFFEVSCKHDRNEGPVILSTWLDNLEWPCDTIDKANAYRSKFLRDVLADVWCLAEYPERYFPRRWWVDLFRDAGYPRPTKPLTIFRGATSSRRLGMSWTTSRERAEWFAQRYIGETSAINAYIYRTTVHPIWVLCRVDGACQDGGRGEGEVVVEPLRLGKITRHDVTSTKRGELTR